MSIKTAEITIERLKLSELKPHPKNPRIHPEKNSDEWNTIKESLRHDYFDPIVWNKRNGMLVSGHLRVKVLEELGYTDVDVSVVDYDDDMHLARMLAANKLQGSNDEDLLAQVLFDIDAVLDVDLAGYTKAEAESYLYSIRFEQAIHRGAACIER